MKKLIQVFAITVLSTITYTTFAQDNRSLQNFREPGQDGINVFETPKADTVEFDGVKVRVGGAFAIQFQALDQTNAADNFVDLGSNFNLPTANLDIDVQLYDGIRMHLRTYLSARHHPEAWVKGGYLQMDNLNFISEGFLEDLMDVTNIRIGLDEVNYGDAHFRRSDNAQAIYNPFVGNYIMDAFTTEVFGEVTVQSNGIIGVLGMSNGKLNQNVIVNDNTDNKPSLYGKLGYDSQISDDLRFRLTGSFYTNKGLTTGTSLYGGDRAGARYYNIGITLPEAAAGANATNNFTTGRFNPGFKQLTAIQINPFIKFQGLEFFGIYEVANNGEDEGNGSYTQVAGELLYRFGGKEQLYVGGRYNTVSGNANDTAEEININRVNIGGGWFITKNILTKLEYVNQDYEGNAYTGTKFEGAGFNGFVLEAVINF